jgi:hypothetical protein
VDRNLELKGLGRHEFSYYLSGDLEVIVSRDKKPTAQLIGSRLAADPEIDQLHVCALR